MNDPIDFNEINIFDDGTSESAILKETISKRQSEEPLHVLDVGGILKKHQVWSQQLPRITPYFAIKCNPDPTVIKVLAALGGHFDCASKQEIVQVMSQGVSGDRIIFAHPIKFPSHVEYAKQVGVSLMTVDNEHEIRRIKRIYPEAEILIRFRYDTKLTVCRLGKKFGCDPEKEAVQLIKVAIAEGMELRGFSFHVGSPCYEPSAICRGINLCKDLIRTAKSLGCTTANIINIGGGIPGRRDSVLDEFSGAINATLEDVDSSIRIIAEPGRYFVTSAFTAVACIINKRIDVKDGQKSFAYYVTDGVYGTFLEEWVGIQRRQPFVVSDKQIDNEEKYTSKIWGPTCDSRDCVLEETLMPEADVGDWLAWYNVGAYAGCSSTRFNGFEPAAVVPVMRRADWVSLCQEINEKKGRKN